MAQGYSEANGHSLKQANDCHTETARKLAELGVDPEIIEKATGVRIR